MRTFGKVALAVFTPLIVTIEFISLGSGIASATTNTPAFTTSVNVALPGGLPQELKPQFISVSCWSPDIGWPLRNYQDIPHESFILSFDHQRGVQARDLNCL